MSKSSELRKLTQEHKKAQQVNADVADYFMQELTRRLQEGEINGGQFVADAIAANRLSRDAAVKLAAKYVREARKLTAPKLLDLRPVEPKFDVLQSTVRASATVRAEEIRAKVRAEVDRRVAEQRAWRAELEAHVTPREKEILEKQKERIRKTAGRWNKADVAKAGRQVVIRSAESAGSGWRVVTDGRPCAFCAMLASYGEDVKGAEHWSNHYFHPGCGCTIQEVPLGTEVEYTEQEKKLIALREEAENHGTTKGEITAYMREHGQGILKDATVPQDERKKSGLKSKPSANQTKRDQGAKAKLRGAVKHQIFKNDEAWKKASQEDHSTERGTVSFPEGGKQKDKHEIDIANKIADHGLDVAFLPEVEEYMVKNPDAEILGDVWEFKAPEGGGKNTISNQFKRAHKQAKRLVIDLSRSELDDQEAISDAERRFFGQRKFYQMLIISHSGSFHYYSLRDII